MRVSWSHPLTPEKCYLRLTGRWLYKDLPIMRLIVPDCHKFSFKWFWEKILYRFEWCKPHLSILKQFQVWILNFELYYFKPRGDGSRVGCKMLFRVPTQRNIIWCQTPNSLIFNTLFPDFLRSSKSSKGF